MNNITKFAANTPTSTDDEPRDSRRERTVISRSTVPGTLSVVRLIYVSRVDRWHCMQLFVLRGPSWAQSGETGFLCDTRYFLWWLRLIGTGFPFLALFLGLCRSSFCVFCDGEHKLLMWEGWRILILLTTSFLVISYHPYHYQDCGLVIVSVFRALPSTSAYAAQNW